MHEEAGLHKGKKIVNLEFYIHETIFLRRRVKKDIYKPTETDRSFN